MSRHPTVIVDTDRTALVSLLDERLGARVQHVRPATPHAAVVAAAAAPADLVVIDSAGEAADAGAAPRGRPADEAVAAITQPARWWLRAADVVGAFVVVVSGAEVFGGPTTPDRGSARPDEYGLRNPATPRGRALRIVEHLVTAAGGGIVRSGPGEPGDGLADVLAWVVAGRHSGAWHVDGDRLDATFTGIAMADAPVSTRPEPRDDSGSSAGHA